MSPALGLAFNVLILVALCVTTYYCLRLSRQFEQMKADRQAFDALIKALNFASARAETSIQAFKETATGSGDVLQERINKARAMADELEIMIEAGDSLAERLQNLAEKSGRAVAETKAAASSGGIEPREAQTGLQPRTRAEKELLEAIKAKQQS